MQYFEEATRIWQTFVAKSGQAETVQGELLRAVEKLRDEATRIRIPNREAVLPGFILVPAPGRP